jgi:small redox-active disulfide protein 2
MKIEICGGCQGCMNIEMNIIEACAQLNIDCDIVHVQDMNVFSKLGVSGTPAVLVDGKIVVSGKVPSVIELKRILKKQDDN